MWNTVDLWNKVRMDKLICETLLFMWNACKPTVRKYKKIAHLTTFMGGGIDFVWNKENALENHENQPKLEKKNKTSKNIINDS